MSGGVTSLPPLRLTDNHFTASPSIGDFLDNSNKSPTASVSFQAFDYASYEDRLKSFEDFPHKNVSKEAFAKAGFYYTGRNDLVRCAFCNIEGYQWNAGDDPALDHKTWSPQCCFVMSLSGPNNSRSVDTCGLYGGEILPNSVSENEVPSKKFGKKVKRPIHQDKSLFESRLKTFGAWPKAMKQTPHDLAEAGLFYVGVGDQTICFHCGGGLKDWMESDDPWEEHAYWYPNCTYLYAKKGQDYISEVKEKRDPRVGLASTSSSSSESESETKEKTSLNGNKAEKKSENGKEGEAVVNNICGVCLENQVSVVFAPCGHFSCSDCFPSLTTCPFCRKPLESMLRIFLPTA